MTRESNGGIIAASSESAAVLALADVFRCNFVQLHNLLDTALLWFV